MQLFLNFILIWNFEIFAQTFLWRSISGRARVGECNRVWFGSYQYLIMAEQLPVSNISFIVLIIIHGVHVNN